MDTPDIDDVYDGAMLRSLSHDGITEFIMAHKRTLFTAYLDEVAGELKDPITLAKAMAFTTEISDFINKYHFSNSMVMHLLSIECASLIASVGNKNEARVLSAVFTMAFSNNLVKLIKHNEEKNASSGPKFG